MNPPRPSIPGGQAMIAGVMANHQRDGGLILAATHVELGATRQLRIGGAA